MFTVKMRFVRWSGTKPGAPVEIAEESDTFILADEVHARTRVTGLDWEQTMKAWELGTYFQMLSVTYYDTGGDPVFYDGRLIQVDRNGKSTWYLVSHAWLLGADGRTIERVAP